LILEGVKVGLFTPGEAFEVVARKRILKLKEPATKMVTLVCEELKIVFHNALAKVGGSILRMGACAVKLFTPVIDFATL
jgi:hypothetical protein